MDGMSMRARVKAKRSMRALTLCRSRRASGSAADISGKMPVARPGAGGRVRMHRRFTMLLASLLAGPAAAADTHPFSVHDMLAMDRISDPRVSPDGRSVAFTVPVTDLEADKGRSDLWIVSTSGGAARRLTRHEADDIQARWSADGKTLFFLSTRTGSAQVFRLSLAGGEAQPVTSLSLDADALELAPAGRHL